MIYVIGDSHSAVFSGEEVMQPQWPSMASNTLPYFKTYRIGPATAYNLNNKISTIDHLIEIEGVDKTNDKILFAFGEIDIRAHIIKHANANNISHEMSTDIVFNRYVEVLMYYKQKGYNVMVWGPIPSWHPNKQHAMPSYGTCMERNNVTMYFNQKLEKFCGDNHMEFITVFYDLVDENNITLVDYLDDWEGSHVHLNQKALPIILDKFREKKLI